MFTGLIEELGIVFAIQDDDPNSKLIKVKCSVVATDAHVGDSISINGCCLTIVLIEDNLISFQAGSETLSRTNLGQLRNGDKVNLERALPALGRLGGHYVLGHIDDIATVCQRDQEGDWVKIWFAVNTDLTSQMAAKGSIAVDGISLTLVDVERERFSVALIPHTLEMTTLGFRSVGDTVNIETDILAKYVQQQLMRREG